VFGETYVAGGTFMMGAHPMHPEEGPPRVTRVGGFWIDKTEVTNGDFARFVAATGYVTLAERPLDAARYPGLAPDQLRPSSLVFVGAKDPAAGPLQWWRITPGADWRHPQGPGSSINGRDALPVVHIAWEDAAAFAHWLGRDLPTEAEWEYAALGAAVEEPAGKPDGNVWQGVFPVIDTGEDGYKAKTAPVGCFSPNGYGLYDMAGNVWEWTRDWYAPNLDPTAGESPEGPKETAAYDPADPGVRKHVIKGGSFLCADNYCLRYRPPARQAGPTDTGSSHIGFRTVRRE
jgi:formylglycine-generating enzyme required for sulfatase activity